VYLHRGDTALTRRATKHSKLRAVVVEWSRTRKRYERQVILVEEAALELAEEERITDADIGRSAAKALSPKAVQLAVSELPTGASGHLSRAGRPPLHSGIRSRRERAVLYPGCPAGTLRRLLSTPAPGASGASGAAPRPKLCHRKPSSSRFEHM